MGRTRFVFVLPCATLLLFLSDLAGAVQQASRGRATALSKDQGSDREQQAQADAAAVLSSLLKKLQAEQQTKQGFAENVNRWCRNAKAQRNAMAETVERKLEESQTLLNQIDAESKRLHSEAQLVDANTQEKKEQELSAKDAEALAEQEFDEEQKDVAHTIEAVHHAIRLVSRSASGALRHGDSSPAEVTAVSNLVQIASEDSVMSDAEKQIMSSYVSDTADKSSSGAASKREARKSLLATLSGMLSRLQQEKNSAITDEGKEKTKLGAFDQHLQDALVATTSERRALDFEMAQRKRDHARFESQVSDLGGLLKSVKSGAQVATDACWDYENDRTRMETYLSAEIDAVKSALEQTAPESADMYLAPTSLSFLQLSSTAMTGDLRAMASKYPAQSSLYLQAARELEAAATRTSLIQRSTSSPASDSDGATSTNAASAIQDIEAFAEDSSSGGGSVADPLGGVSASKAKATYQKLLSQLQQQQKTLRDEGTWCASILGEAQAGQAAIARSLKQSKARLNLMKVAMLQYEKSTQYYQAQANAAHAAGEELATLTAAERALYAQATKEVSEFSKQLMSLGMELNSSPLAEDRRNAGVVAALVQKLEGHQNLCEAGHTEWDRWTSKVSAADTALHSILKTDVMHNDRRILQFKTESQFLQSMEHSRANDKALASGYQFTAKKICPDGLPDQLKEQQSSLEQQVKDLQASYNQKFSAQEESSA